MATRIILFAFVFLFITSLTRAQSYRVDSSFGTNGIFIPRNFPAALCYNHLRKILVQPDNKIILAGAENSQSTTLLVRLKANGTPDSSFGQNGYYYANTAGTNFANAALSPDGRILVIFSVYTVSGSYDIAYRINTNGTADASFGNNGVVTLTNGTYGGYFTPVFQPDGKILIGGGRYVNTNCNLYGITRLNTNGSTDSSFGQNGRIENVFPQYASIVTYANNIALQPDGKILMSTSIPDTSFTRSGFTTIRFKSNGVVDSSFGVNGCREFVADSLYLNPSALFSDSATGDIFIAGLSRKWNTTTASGGNPFIVKMNSSGLVTSNWGSGGLVRPAVLFTDLLGPRNFPLSFIRQANGYFIIAGASDTGVTAHTRLCRLTASGTPDAGFCNTGAVMDINRNLRDMPLSCTLQTGGSNSYILAGGFSFGKQVNNTHTSDTTRMYCVRLTNKPYTNAVSSVSHANASMQVYPNPCTGNTIHMQIPGITTGTHIQLSLYDATGRLVNSAEDNIPPSGVVSWPQAQKLSPGTYLLLAHTDNDNFLAKITVSGE